MYPSDCIVFEQNISCCTDSTPYSNYDDMTHALIWNALTIIICCSEHL